MALNEVFRSPDEPLKKLEKKENMTQAALAMWAKHERDLSGIGQSAGFEEAALKATQEYEKELRNFLKENDAEELYEDVVQSVRDQLHLLQLP